MNTRLLVLTATAAQLMLGSLWAAPGRPGQPPTPTTFSNLQAIETTDQGTGSTGWGSCTGAGCAGGQNPAVTFQMLQQQQTPSLDGQSAQFQISSGQPYSNALWWYKIGGGYDAYSRFTLDFWLQVDPNTATAAQALEFDTFQYLNPNHFMFGTQCDYFKGTWDVWNDAAGQWIPSRASCPKFQPGHWYHVVWNYHRQGTSMVYDSVVVQQYDASGSRPQGGYFALLSMSEPAGPLPAGWNNILGVQVQLDLNGNPTGGTFNIWIDKLDLTVR